MPSRKMLGAAAMTAALAAGGVVGATVGYPSISGAQKDATPTSAPTDSASPPDRGEDHGPGRRGFRGAMDLEVAAKALGVTADELRTQLKAGKSLADVAKAEGVDKQTVIDALVADATTRLAKAVKSGKLTQAESDIRSADLADRIAQEVDEVHRGGPRKAGD